MTLEAHVGPPIHAKLLNGEVFTFERITPTILVELGSYFRARTGQGSRWLTLDECMALIQTIEGMRWLAWRCATRHQPEYAGAAGMPKFEPLVEDWGLLTDLVAAITKLPEDESGNEPPPETAA